MDNIPEFKSLSLEKILLKAIADPEKYKYFFNHPDIKNMNTLNEAYQLSKKENRKKVRKNKNRIKKKEIKMDTPIGIDSQSVSIIDNFFEEASSKIKKINIKLQEEVDSVSSSVVEEIISKIEEVDSVSSSVVEEIISKIEEVDSVSSSVVEEINKGIISNINELGSNLDDVMNDTKIFLYQTKIINDMIIKVDLSDEFLNKVENNLNKKLEEIPEKIEEVKVSGCFSILLKLFIRNKA
jgi:hypothetical protein